MLEHSCCCPQRSQFRPPKMSRKAALRELLTTSCRPPAWWKTGRPRQVHGSLPEVQLLSHLAVLLKPGVPIGELFRDFPTERSPAWGANRLSPDLALYGVLKQKSAALFLEYDGYYRHHETAGLAADKRKTEALLDFAPPGSMVVRVAHAWRDLAAWQNSTEVIVDRWSPRRKQAVLVPVQQLVDGLLEKLGDTLAAPLRRSLQSADLHASTQCLNCACDFVDDTEFEKDPTRQRTQLRSFLEASGFNEVQIAKVAAGFPQVLGCSIEANLKPTVEWLRDLGLSPAQITKVVSVFPQVLGCSIEANLKPTVEWLRDLGLSPAQIAKVVSVFPQVLGCSIEANLKPTVEWLRDLGLSPAQIAKVVSGSPQVLGCSIEANLKPTVEWLRDLGLSPA